MVRIVSGSQRDPNIALLQGMQIGQQYRQAQRQREDDERAQMDQLLQMRRLKMQLDAEQLKQEQFLSQQAQMGNAQAIQKIALRQRMSPGEKRSEAAMQLLEGITDPKAYAVAAKSIGNLLTVEEQQERRVAASKEIERAIKDGILAPPPMAGEEAKPDKSGMPSSADFMAELEAGGDPDALVKRLSTFRMDRATKAANMEENSIVRKQVQAQIEAMPPGRERTLSQIAAKEWDMSPSVQEDPGSAAKLLAHVKELRVGPLSRQEAIAESTKAWGESRPAPGLQGMSVGERNAQMMREPFGWGWGGPKVPPFQAQGPQAHATVRGTNRKAQSSASSSLPLQEILKAADPDGVVGALEAAGLELNEENISAAMSEWGARDR